MRLKTIHDESGGIVDQKYGEGVLTLTLKDQYYNMREMVEPHPEVIDKAFKAMEQAGGNPDCPSDPWRYRWRPSFIHGIALSEFIHWGNELPR